MKKTLASLVALGLAASASAQTNSVDIKFDDLDLGTRKGQSQLDNRIANAARAICGIDETTLGSRLRDRDAIACYKEAKAKARQKVARLMEAEGKGG